MPNPNLFKRALQAGQPQIGLCSMLSSPYVSEILAGSGFDWLLLDAENTPTEVPQMLQQLQGVAAAPVREGCVPTHAVVRPAWNDRVLIKRYLDIGAQTLLLPFVQTAEEARAAVEAVRYPPQGVRGLGGSMRASNFGRDSTYIAQAADEICVLVQVETRSALVNLEEIARVDGVDGIFIGPSDLSASLGYEGYSAHDDMGVLIEDVLGRIRACGKAPGILATNPERVASCIQHGALFVGVGIDLVLLRASADALAARFKALQAIPTMGAFMY